MTSSVSGLLVAVLLMAALLGVLIGVAASSLLQRRREASTDAEPRPAGARAQAIAEVPTESVDRLRQTERERDELREALVAARAGERDAVARHEALRMHARTLGRRLDAQLGEQRASEERQIRLERALRVQREEYRLVDAAVGDAKPGARRTPATTDVAADGDLPVLGRRVDATARGPAAGKLAAGTARARPSARPGRRQAGSGTTGDEDRAIRSDARATAGQNVRPGSRPTSRTVSRLGSGRLARSSARALTGSSVDASSATPVLDGDEYPALSEAELPDSIDALEFAASRTASTSR